LQSLIGFEADALDGCLAPVDTRRAPFLAHPQITTGTASQRLVRPDLHLFLAVRAIYIVRPGILENYSTGTTFCHDPDRSFLERKTSTINHHPWLVPNQTTTNPILREKIPKRSPECTGVFQQPSGERGTREARG
jgi:hypothetical protein